jgi:hypothetical protein
MRCRLRFLSYVGLTVLAFVMVGRPPRVPTLRAQDLPATVSATISAGEA